MPASYRQPRDPEELYDLKGDPLETENLVGNPSYADVRRQLSDQLTSWQEATEDPVLKGPMLPPEGARVDPVPW